MDGLPGTWQRGDSASPINAVSALIRKLIGQTGTVTLVQVQAVRPSALGANIGTVDVQQLVHQVNGAGQVTPHGTTFGLPYLRLQGGANAVVIDPVVGDIGIAVIASRDISKVKATRAAAAPDSFRQFDHADGIYVGGILNGAPTQYVAFTGTGIAIVSPTQVTITAPIVTMSGVLQVTGDVFAGFGAGDQVELQGHTHSGVQSGGSTTGPPVPGT